MGTGDTQEQDKPQTFYLLHVPGGGLWGKHSLRVLSAIEKICNLNTVHLFNMTSGGSVGGIITSSLNIPKSKGSDEPRFSADEVNSLFDQIITHLFPPRAMYYPRQLIVDGVIRNVHKVTAAFLGWGLASLDNGLNNTLNTSRKWLHDKTRRKSVFSPVNIRPFKVVHEKLVSPLEKRIDQGINRLAKRSLYSLEPLGRLLTYAYRFEDTGEPVMLGDTILPHHVSAMNISKAKPAFFFHMKDPANQNTTYLSHENTHLMDIAQASSAAPSVFEPKRLPNGDYYIDIAHFDTPLSPIASLERHSMTKLDIKLVTIGTGEPSLADPELLSGMLFLNQLSSEYGAPLLRNPQRFINERDLMILKERFDKDSLVDINLTVTMDSMGVDYLQDPRAQRVAEYLKFDLNSLSTANLPSHDIFDSRPENMKNIEDFGWLMTMKNLDTILPLCKGLIQNAHAKGHIDEQGMEWRLDLLDYFNGAAGHEYCPKEKPQKASKLDWPLFNEVTERTLFGQLCYIWQRAQDKVPNPLPLKTHKKPADSLPKPPDKKL